jgi:hypothetical protein
MSFKFKEIFLKLTEYTIPYGHEDKIIPYINDIISKYGYNLKKDNIGNYYVIVGNSKTLFTTHLDTYSVKYEKVNHIIDNDWIKTDKSTILGGDNKNGTTILLYLISKNIPGTYYFFIGEEPILSGCIYGSRSLYQKNPKFLKKYNKAIAFDRKQTGSIVTRQLARQCCSNEFADYLISEFKKNGLNFQKDPNAYYTDTASFLDIIPEITNISAGGWGEHTNNEKTLITYVESVALAASKINWENAPIIREPKPIITIKNDKKYPKSVYNESVKIFDLIDNIFSNYGYRCLNINQFNIDTNMIFSHWHKNSEFEIKIINDIIYVNNEKIGDFYLFKKYFNVQLEEYLDEDDFIDNLNKPILNKQEMDNILKKYYSNSNELINLINNQKIDYILYKNNKFHIIL